MMNKTMLTLRKIFFIITLLFTCSVVYGAFKDTGWGARPSGLSGAFTAVCDDSNACFYNPSGIAGLSRPELNFMFARFYTGLDDVNLGSGYLSFVNPLDKNFYWGINWRRFSCFNRYEEDTFLISAAITPLKLLSIGLNGKYLSHKYVLDERTKTDPVFSNGNSKGAFTFDIGALIKNKTKPPFLAFGLVVKNITQPDVGLKTKDTVPCEIHVGISSKLGSLNVTRQFKLEDTLFAFDIGYRDEDINYHLGVESWIYQRTFGVRLGTSSRDISLGFSYNSELFKGFGLQIDYAFVFPYYIEQTYGTHKLSCIIRFGESPDEVRYFKRVNRLNSIK